MKQIMIGLLFAIIATTSCKKEVIREVTKKDFPYKSWGQINTCDSAGQITVKASLRVAITNVAITDSIQEVIIDTFTVSYSKEGVWKSYSIPVKSFSLNSTDYYSQNNWQYGSCWQQMFVSTIDLRTIPTLADAIGNPNWAMYKFRYKVAGHWYQSFLETDQSGSVPTFFGP